jgi:hypothetical protein
MAAGESAYDVARRQREKAERLQKSAALWEKGAEGEVAVARALAELPEGWVALHDLGWPGRQRANLDHVVVGPCGVFIVDAKNWSGRVEVRDQVLVQNGRRREDAVSSATAAAIAVQAIVAPHTCLGVLCFVRDEAITGSSWNVTVCSTANLVAMLTSRESMLGPGEVSRCVEAIKLAAVRPSVATSLTPDSGRAAPRRVPARRRRGSPVAALIGATVLLAAVFSGGLEKAADWAGEWMVERIVQNEPARLEPTEPAQQRKQKQQKKERRQRGGQQSR